MILEQLNCSLASSQHGRYEHILEVYLIDMHFPILALLEPYIMKRRVHEIKVLFELLVLLTREKLISISFSDCLKFKVE